MKFHINSQGSKRMLARWLKVGFLTGEGRGEMSEF